MDGRRMTQGASELIDWTEFYEQTVECVLSYFYSKDYMIRGATSLAEDVQSNEIDEKGRPYFNSVYPQVVQA